MLWTERLQAEREIAHRANICADMEVLSKFRDGLIHGQKAHTDPAPLIAAIDEHVRKLTSNRTSLHAGNASDPDPWWEKP